MDTKLKIAAANFDSEISRGVTLVHFWTSWYGPCRMQGPIVENVATKMAGKAKVGKCNVDEEQDLAVRLGIRSILTLIIFENGKEVEWLIGLHVENVLIEKLNALAVTAQPEVR